MIDGQNKICRKRDGLAHSLSTAACNTTEINRTEAMINKYTNQSSVCYHIGIYIGLTGCTLPFFP